MRLDKSRAGGSRTKPHSRPAAPPMEIPEDLKILRRAATANVALCQESDKGARRRRCASVPLSVLASATPLSVEKKGRTAAKRAVCVTSFLQRTRSLRLLVFDRRYFGVRCRDPLRRRHAGRRSGAAPQAFGSDPPRLPHGTKGL